MDALVGCALKGVELLHVMLSLQRGVCCVDKGSLPQSVKWLWG